MARKITDKQLYKLKNDELKAMFTQVTPYEFYRDVFPAGSLGVHGDLSVRKPNLIYTMTVRKDEDDEKAKVYARNTIVFDDLEGLQGAAGAEFAVTSPVSYRGRNRTAANAYHLWGFCIDLDGVGMDQMHDLLYQIQNDVLPTPTYLINSGHGFHVYYLLEEPIPLYKHLHRPLNDLKHGLTRIVWNAYTSNIEPEKRQFQGIFQGFRMPGSQSKLGKRYPVVAFRVGEKTTIETLNRYVDDQYRMTDAEEYRMPHQELLSICSAAADQQALKALDAAYDEKKRVLEKAYQEEKQELDRIIEAKKEKVAELDKKVKKIQIKDIVKKTLIAVGIIAVVLFVSAFAVRWGTILRNKVDAAQADQAAQTKQTKEIKAEENKGLFEWIFPTSE